MNPTFSSVTGAAADIRVSTVADYASREDRIDLTAGQLLALLQRGQAVTTNDLGDVMTRTFDGTDAEGFWLWKDAYEGLWTVDKSPVRSIMPEDGTIETPANLLRPTGILRVELRYIEETSWEEADARVFTAAWDAELVALLEFTISPLHIVTGLLLSIWRRLPQNHCRVFRLQTHDGERTVGRKIAALETSGLCRNLGMNQVQSITADQAWPALIDGSSVIAVTKGQTLGRVRVMNQYLVELSGLRGNARMAEIDRAVFRDHLLEDANVRADDHGRRSFPREADRGLSAGRSRGLDLKGV